MKKCGIYKIVNNINGKFYIGSSTDIEQRFVHHVSLLNNNKHENSYLQNAWNKYGKCNFSMFIVNECNIADLIKIEQIFIDGYYNTGVLYNLNPIAGKPPVCGENNPMFREENKIKIRNFMNKPEYKNSLYERNKKNGFPSAKPENRKKSSDRMRLNNPSKNIDMEKHPCSKLKRFQVKEIREKYKSGNYSYSNIAKEYHVSKKTILNVIKNRIWKDVL